jgi:hypothetical protein
MWLAAAAGLVLVGVFAVISLSVVHGRRSLDTDVLNSFAVVASGLSGPKRAVIPNGCRKQRVNYYDCSADVRPTRRGRAVVFHFRLALRDDGCWNAPVARPRAARTYFRPLEGCI